MLTFFVLAGEHSGDLHGGPLLKALQDRLLIQFFGVGGPEMQAQGLSPCMSMEQFQVFGFTDIVRKFPRLWRQFRQIRNLILERNPDGVLLIDYPGFNLRLAKALRTKGYKGKIIQYICPTVWAWGRGRIQKLASTADLLLTIFPFEPPLFAHTSLPTHFVGHPLIEKISTYIYDPNWRDSCALSQRKRTLAIFPGSRLGEIQRLFPRQLAAALILQKKDPDLSICISCVDKALQAPLEQILTQAGQQLTPDLGFVPKRYTYELMREAHTAIAKSGTVTLELALHNTPSVVVYDITLLNALIAHFIFKLRLPHYCIVNILCGKMVYPEFIRKSFTAESLAASLLELHREGLSRTACLEGCQLAKEALHTPSGQSAAAAAAAFIEELF